ncbi:MAG: class I SAM-dependent methyltransferase [Chitinophagales bacterium]|nr:class I SAM-dependent methyltransferase [Chitinophagales bacterium]
MAVYTTEIASESIASDGPIHKRLLKAYYLAKPYIHGDLLELGCGEGRGVELLSPLSKTYTAVDKIVEVGDTIRRKYQDIRFINMNIPPFKGLDDDSFDTIVSFQVIEHIQEDKVFLEEIHRVLKPGGVAVITTPNSIMSLTRNPWHIREYTAQELIRLTSSIFKEVQAFGITGNEKIWNYYEKNKAAVAKYKKLDIFGLEKRLPASVLRIPYDFLNRINRNKLKKSNENLVSDIDLEDFFISNKPQECIDLFYVLKK